MAAHAAHASCARPGVQLRHAPKPPPAGAEEEEEAEAHEGAAMEEED